MKTVAITGGIAGGKSAVSAMFADLGAEVHSADEDARAVLAPGSPTLSAVLNAFPTAKTPDGRLDRAALAAVIFADLEARIRLNSLMHPAIRARMRAAIDAAKASERPGALVYEVPLLYEGGLETWFDVVIAVLASSKRQAERLQEREAKAGRIPLTDPEIAERLSAQLPPEEKARRADYVIRTDVSMEETRHEVARVFHLLKE